MTCGRWLRFLVLLASSALGCASAWAQFSGQLAPDHLGAGTGTVQFLTTDVNATATGLPSWFKNVTRAVSTISAGNYRVTTTWGYQTNWSANAVTENRSAQIVAGSYSQTITQAGIDNTYAYEMQVVNSEIPYTAATTTFLKVWARVSGSTISLVPDGSAWKPQAEGWLTWRFDPSGSFDQSPTYPSSVITGSLTGASFNGRTYYRRLQFVTDQNWGDDLATGNRSASFKVGPLGAENDSFTVIQVGVDNIYVFDPPLDQVRRPSANSTYVQSTTIYARVKGSSLERVLEGPAWGPAANGGWISVESSNPISLSATPAFQGRGYYGNIYFKGTNNWAPDTLTESRTATFRIGAPGRATNTVTTTQAGVDNTYKVNMSTSIVAATGGSTTIKIRGGVYGSDYTYASASSWITPASRTGGLSTSLPTTPATYESSPFSITAASQGTDKSKWYEPRTGSFLIQGKPYALEQRGAGFRFESAGVRGSRRGEVSISYRIGNQKTSTSVRMFYALDGATFTEILPASFTGGTGHIGANVVPGLHTLVWNATTLAATLPDSANVMLKVMDTDGWYAFSQPFSLEPLCDSHCTSCPPGSVEVATNSIDASVSLGSDALGRSYGRLWVHEDTANDALRTPAALWRQALQGAQTFPANAANFTQVLTPAVLAEIEDSNPSDNTWSVRLYDRASQLGPFVSGTGLYNQSAATPFQTITFTVTEKAGKFVDSVRIAESGSLGDRVHLYTWSPDANGNANWRLSQANSQGSVLRQESVSETISTDGLTKTEDRRVLEPNGDLAARVVVTKRTFPFGERVTREERFIVNADGTTSGSRSTFYAYGETSGQSGYGLLLETYTDYDATWASYAYNIDGLSTIRRPFRSAGRGSADADLDVTSITWHRGEFGFGPAQDLAKITTRRLAGQVVSRTVEVMYQDVLGGTLSDGSTPFSYQERWSMVLTDNAVDTVAGALSSSSALITKTRTYASGAYQDQVRSILKPDGTIVIHEYTAATTVRRSGVASADGHSILEGLRDEESSNEFGEQVSLQAVALPENLVVAEEIAQTRDALGRPTLIRHIDGSTDARQYSCCGLIGETGRDGSSTTYVRDILGRIQSHTRLGVTTTYDLNATGRPRSITESAGDLSIQRRSTVMDSLGVRITAIDARNRSTTLQESFGADGGRILTTTYPDGGTQIKSFYADGQLRSVTGTAALPLRYEYGVDPVEGAYLKEIRVGDQGQETEWTQAFTDLAGRVVKVIENHERGVPSVAARFYNNRGQLVRSVDPDGVITLFDYNALGEPVAAAVDIDQDLQIDWDGPDRILSAAASWTTRNGKAVRRIVRKAYLAQNSATPTEQEVSDASVDGLDTWFNIAGLSSSISTVLQGNGNVLTTVSAPDGTTEQSQVTNGRLSRRTRLDADGAQLSRIDYAYDALGRVQVATDARNGATTFAWFADDQLASISSPDPGSGVQTTAFAYDAAGRLAQTVLPDGGILDREYFLTGLIKRQGGARTYPVSYTYDAQGRIKTLTSAAGTTSWTYYPESGRVQRKIDANGRGPVLSYTAAGRLATRVSARGITTTSTYNFAGDLIGIDYSDLTPDLIYNYLRDGRMGSVRKEGSTTSYIYNSAGQIESERITGGPLDSVTVDPSYDAVRRRSSLVVSGPGWSNPQSYGYDSSGRLSSIQAGDSAFAYTYAADSDLLATTVSSTKGQPILAASRTWDVLDRLQSIQTSSTGFQQRFAYDHNAANQRARVTREDGSRREFGYDALGQLSEATERLPSGEILESHSSRFTYDAAGNRRSALLGASGDRLIGYTPRAGDGTQYQSIAHPGMAWVTGSADPAASITVDGAPVTSRPGQSGRFQHQLLVDNRTGPVGKVINVAATLGGNTETEARQVFVPAAEVTPEYDLDGNLTFDGFLEYTWDAENRLQTIRPRTGLSPPGSTLRNFRQSFTYDHAGRRVRRQTWVTINGQEYPASDDLFVYDGWNQVAILDSETKRPRQTCTWGLDISGTLQGAGGVGGLLRITDAPSGTAHFPAYDGNGNLTALIEATTGLPTATYDYDPFGNVLQATGSFANNNPWRFSTKPRDPFTGQYDYGYRDYDPTTGRWLSRDPLGEAGGVNLYGFVGNDPVGGVDVLGMLDLRLADAIDQNPNPLTYYTDHYLAASIVGSDPIQDLVYLHYGLDAAAGSRELRLEQTLAKNAHQQSLMIKRQVLKNAFFKDKDNPTCGESFLYHFFKDFNGFGTVGLYEGYSFRDLYSQEEIDMAQARMRAGFGAVEVVGTALTAAEFAGPVEGILRKGIARCKCKPSKIPKIDISSLDFTTEANRAVFYSGPGNHARAMAFAEKTGATPIDLTPGGQYLNSLKLYDILPAHEADAIWAKASQAYATAASGKINLFVKGARLDRVYHTVEVPLIKANPLIYKQTFHY